MLRLFPCKLSLLYSCCYQTEFFLTEKKKMLCNFTWETCSAAFTFTLNDLVMTQHEQNRLYHDENTMLDVFVLCCSFPVKNYEGSVVCLTGQTGQVWPPESAAGWHKQRCSPADQWGQRPAGPTLWPPSRPGPRTQGWWMDTGQGSRNVKCKKIGGRVSK